MNVNVQVWVGWNRNVKMIATCRLIMCNYIKTNYKSLLIASSMQDVKNFVEIKRP